MCSLHINATFCFSTENRLCISRIEADAAAEDNKDTSSPPGGRSCELAVTSHNKFVWPGIDAIIEAYARHVEGDDCCNVLMRELNLTPLTHSQKRVQVDLYLLP